MEQQQQQQWQGNKPVGHTLPHSDDDDHHCCVAE